MAGRLGLLVLLSLLLLLLVVVFLVLLCYYCYYYRYYVYYNDTCSYIDVLLGRGVADADFLHTILRRPALRHDYQTQASDKDTRHTHSNNIQR